MPPVFEQILPPFLGIAAVAYVALAVSVSRSGSRYTNSRVAFLLVLFAGMLAGSAFSYGAIDATYYNIGRALSFFAAGFLPVVFYVVYREFTMGGTSGLFLMTLCIIPVVTTGLAVTNGMHEMLWTVQEVDGGLVYSDLTDHFWYNRVYAPFVYGLIGVTAIALLGRMPSIAAAHRKTVGTLLLCGMLPFIVSVVNIFFGMGPPNFPFSSMTLGLLWPAFAYFSVKTRVHEFSPLAYQTLFNHVRDPIFVVDEEQRIVCANHAAEKLIGCRESEMLGGQLWEDYPAASKVLKQAKELDLTQTLQLDSSKTLEVSVSALTGPYGQDLGMVVVCRDVTERRMAQQQVADSEHLIRTLVETSSNGILRFCRDTTDPENRVRCIFANRAAENFVGNKESSLVGMPLAKLPHLKPERLLEHFAGDAANTQISFEKTIDDGKCWLRIVAEPVGDDISVTLVDITERKLNEHAIRAEALQDPLTGLLNRRGFEAQGIAAVRESENGAVLFLDLNNFKAINDNFGHNVGDALLKAFGHRLEFCLRPEDILGRLGGDEFAIVMPNVSAEDVRHIARRLLQTAADAYIIQGQEIQCSASIGISLMPKHGDELWQLLNVADEAMYSAKSLPDGAAANDCAAYIDAVTAS